MLINEITKRYPDGAVGADLVLEIEEVEKPMNLGDADNLGMERLIEIHNALNKFLLGSAHSSKLSGTKSSTSYGMVYLIESLLHQQCDTINGNQDSDTLDALPSILTALLDNETDASVSLEELSSRIFFPNHCKPTKDLLNHLFRELEQIDLAVRSADSTKTDEESPSSDSEISIELAFKLNAWCSQNSLDTGEMSDRPGYQRLIDLAVQVHKYVENETGMKWQKIQSHMRKLCVVEVVDGASTLLTTTIPSSEQLNIFYRLQLDAPDSVLDHERIEPVVAEEDNLNFDEVFEALETMMCPVCNEMLEIA